MRLNRDNYFMKIAEITAERGTCDRAKVGAVAVMDNRIVMSGYNGSPASLSHCDEAGHLMIDGHCERTVHAEQNIIANAAKFGIPLKGTTLYVTHEPCFHCLKLLISTGITKIIYKNARHDRRTPDEYRNLILIKLLEV